MHEDKSLSYQDYEIAKRVYEEKIEQLINEKDVISKEINELRASLNRIRESGSFEINGKVNIEASILPNIIEIFRNAQSQWLTTTQIRNTYEAQTGQSLAPSTLLKCLNGGNEVATFEKTGPKKFMQWRMKYAGNGNKTTRLVSQ